MKNFIIINRRLFKKKYEYFFSPGVMVNLILAPNPLIKFLREAYNEDSNSLSGDIVKLFSINAEYPDVL